jgi:hypothetical protein
MDNQEEAIEQANKLGIHQDIVTPLIGLVTVSTIAWVILLIVLGRDRQA